MNRIQTKCGKPPRTGFLHALGRERNSERCSEKAWNGEDCSENQDDGKGGLSLRGVAFLLRPLGPHKTNWPRAP